MSATYKPKDKITDITVLEPEATYSYADYLKWEFEERVELIKGKFFRMSPAPKRNHQDISFIIGNEIYNYLKANHAKLTLLPLMFVFPYPSMPRTIKLTRSYNQTSV